jgi:penicillin-binding protein 2
MLTPSSFEDRRSLLTRLSVLRALTIICMALLAVGFWILQVVQNEKYDEMATNNRMRTITLPAPRGILFDRHGVPLVSNRPAQSIQIVRERTRNLNQTIKLLAEVTHEDEAGFREIIDRHRRDPIFRPITVIDDASEAQIAAVLARRLELPEVILQPTPTRQYEPMAAHLFGYVSEIQEAQIDRPEYAGLEAGAIIGQAGVEKIYNGHLMGKDGDRFVVVTSTGREIDELDKRDPVDGQRLQLTIDADVQRALEQGFHENRFAGAAVLLEPNTGEVLAMTSLPAYDPNDFAAGIEGAKWAELNRDPLKPLDNRLIRGRYSPGSTFKILMAVAALSEHLITPDFKVYCPGRKTFYGRSFQCWRWKQGGHGTVDLRQALEQSCNVYFYTLGEMMKIDTIHAYAEKLGLVGKTGIDLPGEIDSLVPSTAWSQRERKQPWYPGETISVSIGQGAVSVTPLALATMMATVANGGTLITPHVVRAVDENGRWKRVPAPAPKAKIDINPKVLQAVRDGLWMVVNAHGTGGRAKIEGKDVSGKTGTSQVISLSGRSAAAGRTTKDLRDHGWFVFFAPRDNPQVAGVVFAEHAEHGADAAPIAKFAMETFFAKEEGRPLPEWPRPMPVAVGQAEPEEPRNLPDVAAPLPSGRGEPGAAPATGGAGAAGSAPRPATGRGGRGAGAPRTQAPGGGHR